VEKIEKQLKKHKQKLQQHKPNGVHPESSAVDIRHDILDILDNPDRPSHRVVKSTQFQAKPMTLDEALMQLDLLDARFYVFQNEKDLAINVVYRRDDGNFGLIEARGA